MVTVVAEQRRFEVRIVGQVVGGSNIGRSLTLFMDELPADARWAVARRVRFRDGADRDVASSRLQSAMRGTPQSPPARRDNRARVVPVRIALWALAAAVMAVGLAQLGASVTLALRARARELATLRTLGLDDRSCGPTCWWPPASWPPHRCPRCRSARSSTGGRPTASRRASASAPGVALPSPLGGHLLATAGLVAGRAVATIRITRAQLARPIATALRTE